MAKHWWIYPWVVSLGLISLPRLRHHCSVRFSPVCCLVSAVPALIGFCPGPHSSFYEKPVQPMQTNPTPGPMPSTPRPMSQGQYDSAQLQAGQIPLGEMPQGQRSPGPLQQQYLAQQNAQPWNQAHVPDAQQYNQGYPQPAVGQEGYRPTQSQVSPRNLTQAQAEQLQASRMQANQAQARQAQLQQLQAQRQLQANPAAAIQHSPRGHLATAPHATAPHARGQASYGPTSPTQYLQRETAPQAASPGNVAPNRYVQPYGHQPPQGQHQAIATTGTAGWTGNQAAPHSGQRLVQRGPQSSLPHRPTTARRYRYEEEEDFAPTFGNPQVSADSWLLSLPVINWHNLPLGNMRFWTALGGIVFAAIMLNVLGTSPVISSIVKSRNRQCQEVIQPNSVLSRQQLTQLIAVPERSPKANIHEIIREPYCLLPSLNIRAGVNAVREAYPLEFDPDTWIVVLYEGDEYAGYRFNAR